MADEHYQLCKQAGRWLKSAFGCGVVVTEFVCAASESPDALGFRDAGGWSVLVEVKVSRSDFLADRKKPHRQFGGMGQERWYLTPPGLLDPSEIPDGWGLAEVHKKQVRRVVTPKRSYLGNRYSRITDPDVCFADMPVLYSIAQRLLTGRGIDALERAVDLGDHQIAPNPAETALTTQSEVISNG